MKRNSIPAIIKTGEDIVLNVYYIKISQHLAGLWDREQVARAVAALAEVLQQLLLPFTMPENITNDIVSQKKINSKNDCNESIIR